MSGPIRPALRVEEEDGSPSVRPVNTIKVTNGTLTDDGSATVSVTTGGGGGGSGTVTSITAAADSGTGTGITTSGTFTFTGGTGLTTSVTGTTVTFDADGLVSNTGTPVNNQLAIWTDATTIEGDAALTWDSSSKILSVDGTLKGGDGSSFAEVTSTGTQSLVLNTDEGTDSGKITIEAGVNNDITIEPDGTGVIKFYDAYSFPIADGDADQVLTTDGAGTLTFEDAGGGGSPGGSTTQVQYNDAGSFAGSANLTFNTVGSGKLTVGNQVKVGDGTAADPSFTFSSNAQNGMYKSAGNEISLSAGATQMMSINGFRVSVKSELSTIGTDDLVLSTNSGTNSGTITITDGVNGAIEIVPNGTGLVKVSNLEVNGAYALPTADGDADQVLTTDGAGTLTFEDAGGGGGTVTVGTYADTNNIAYFSGATEISNTNNISINAGAGSGDFFGSVEAGNVKIGTDTNKNTVETSSFYDLVLRTNGGTNSGLITITDGVNGAIEIAPNGTGLVKVSNLEVNAAYALPTADGDADQVLTTDGAGTLTFEDAGGGSSGQSQYMPNSDGTFATGDNHWAAHSFPYGSAEDTTTQTVSDDKPVYYPFVARRTSSFSKAAIGISSAASSGDLILGIYSVNTTTGMPGTLLGKVTVAATLAAIVDGTLVAEAGQSLDCTMGTTYWLGLVRTESENVTCNAVPRNDAGSWAWSTSFNTDYGVLAQTGSDNTLPATAAPTTGYAWDSILMGVQYAS